PARRGSTPPDPPGPRGPGQPNCPECPRGSPGRARPGRSTCPSHARSAQPPHGTPGRTSSVSLTSLLLIADASTVSGECPTPLGIRVAVLFTKTYGRVLAPGLAALAPRFPPDVVRRSTLAIAWRQFDCALDNFISEA